MGIEIEKKHNDIADRGNIRSGPSEEVSFEGGSEREESDSLLLYHRKIAIGLDSN